MTLSEFALSLQDAADEIRREAPNIIERAAMDMLAVVERRIKEEGVDGATYKSKSKTPYFQGGKGTGAKKDYATHAKVDLTLTGRMWNGISVLGTVQVRDGVYQAQIGGTDQEADTKIVANLARFGDFLAPNEQELRELQEDITEEILDIVRKHIN